jgi:predicted RNase H-like HicB family nuclease
VQKYEISLYWSNEDKTFVAEVPELPGCMAHGKTREKALKNVNQAIELWVDTAKEFRDRIPEPKGRGLVLAQERSAPPQGTRRDRAKRVSRVFF